VPGVGIHFKPCRTVARTRNAGRPPMSTLRSCAGWAYHPSGRGISRRRCFRRIGRFLRSHSVPAWLV